MLNLNLQFSLHYNDLVKIDSPEKALELDFLSWLLKSL